MIIRTPIRQLPACAPMTPNPPHREDRQPAYDAAKKAAGLWVPVECAGHRQALYLANAARKHSTLNLEAEQRGNICYLRYLGRIGFQPVNPSSADLQARESVRRVSR